MKDKLPLIVVSVILLGMLALLGVLLFEPSKSASKPSASSQADVPSAPSAATNAAPVVAPVAVPVVATNATTTAAPVEAVVESAEEESAPKTVEPGPLAARRQELAEAIIRKQIERREARRARQARKEAALASTGGVNRVSRQLGKKSGSSTSRDGGGDASADGSSPLTPEQIDAEVAAQLAELEQRQPQTAVDNFSQSVQDVTEMWRDADVEITADIAKEFKAEFDKMSADEKVENVHEALNRFDDNYLECLKAIATDASEPAEVLEKTVYDLGNRDWDKVRPIFEEIAANPQHGQNAAAKEWLTDHPAETK